MVDFHSVEDDKQYRVKLSKVIKLDQIVLTPVTKNIVKGRVLKTFPEEALISIEEV